MSDILGVKYLEPFDSLRVVLNGLSSFPPSPFAFSSYPLLFSYAFTGVTLHPITTIEEANIQDNSTLTIVRLNDKIRVTVLSPDRLTQHYKIGRSDQLAVFMDQYAKAVHVALDQLSFAVGHRKLEPKQTSEDVGLTEKV